MGARRARRRFGARRGLAALPLIALGLCAGCGGGGSGKVALDPFVLIPATIDVAPDQDEAARTVEIVDRLFAPTDCAVVEGAAVAGLRRLLRFDTVVVNHGALPLVLGDPSAPTAPFTPADFEFAPCHQHYHFLGWALYQLLDRFDGVVATGHKQAFCLLDTDPVVAGRPALGFDCDHQGLSPGWADVYDHTLDGQWVDITGVLEGDYRLTITVNAAGKIVEVDDRWPDTVTVDVHVPDPNLPPP